MRNLVLVALHLSVAGLALHVPRRAEACSPPSSFSFSGVAPADGDTGIPTNTRIWVRHRGSYSGAEVDDIRVRPIGGEPVGTTLQHAANVGSSPLRLWIVRPLVPLLPATTYEILTRVRPSCSYDCITEQPEVIATFTTGDSADTQPPVFAGATGVEIFPLETCDDEACCGPHSSVHYRVDWDPATDSSRIAAYRIYSQDGTMVVGAGGSVGNATCSGTYYGPLVDFWAGPGMYYVRAVDLAGNEDSNMALVSVAIDCTPLPDADPAACGCRMAGAGANHPWHPLMLALAAALGVCVFRQRR